MEKLSATEACQVHKRSFCKQMFSIETFNIQLFRGSKLCVWRPQNILEFRPRTRTSEKQINVNWQTSFYQLVICDMIS